VSAASPQTVWVRVGVAAALAVGLVGCGSDESALPTRDAPTQDETRTAKPQQPNVLFVVWDTVRADHLSLYGYDKPTTPRLEAWARDARVFSDALSTANSTVPSHASLFTGLLPSEHGSHAGHQYLDDERTTLAEIFQQAGYRTYLWAANPHISDTENFTQGFDLAEHPWSERNEKKARRIVLEKLEGDRSSAMRRRIEGGGDATGLLKAAGALAAENTLEFLKQGDASRPWFVFLNYMEAHRHYMPPRRYRELMMSPEQVERSYRFDRSWPAVWAHTFGLQRYPAEDIAVIAGTYDATLRELDDLFADLLTGLGEAGFLDDTIVVLTADHGELIGEHGLLGHQYSLYDPLLRVPLVIHYPAGLEPGVSDAPVSAMDLFPTLLELAGLEAPSAPPSRARSLLSPHEERTRLAELPAIYDRPLAAMEKKAPDLDTRPWRRRLRALHSGPYKLVEGEDGEHELYERASDPGEENDLLELEPRVARELQEELFEIVRGLAPEPERGATPEFSESEARMLEELGYAGRDTEPPSGVAPDAPPSSWSLERGDGTPP